MLARGDTDTFRGTLDPAEPAERPATANRWAAFVRSSVGKKSLMAVTGLLLIAYLVEHLIGNLNLFADRTGAKFTGYVEFLSGYGWMLDVAEVGLLALFVAHIALGMRTALENREARPVRYKELAAKGRRTWSSMSMIVTGAIVLVFLVIHLFDFRLEGSPFVRPDAKELPRRVVERLASPLGAGIYLVGVAVLGVHLWHGFQSLMQSLGLRDSRYAGLIRGLGMALALVLGAGFAAFPIVFAILGHSWFKS